MAWKTFCKYVATVPPPLLPLPFPSLLLEVGPLITGRGSGGARERFCSPSGSGWSPAAKRYLMNFRLKISPLVATIFRNFSGNETSNYRTIGGRVVTYLRKQTVWTSQWHGIRLAMMWRHVWVVLHCILFLLGPWGGGSCSPAPSSNDSPARTGHVTSSPTRPLCSPYAICYRCSTAGSVDVLRDTLVWAGIGTRNAA